MEKGGFPKYLQSSSTRYLSSLYDSIIFRDVMARNGLTNDKEMQELIFYLASNATKRITYTSLGKIVGIRHSETVKTIWSTSKANLYDIPAHEIFAIGKGADAEPEEDLLHRQCHRESHWIQCHRQYGVKLENIVFIELKRRGYDVFIMQIRRSATLLLERA